MLLNNPIPTKTWSKVQTRVAVSSILRYFVARFALTSDARIPLAQKRSLFQNEIQKNL